MPAPAKTSFEAIVRAARRILERDGADAVTMQAVADAVGVRSPSLYKHVHNRTALLEHLDLLGFKELGRVLAVAARTRDPLPAMATAYRRFALTSPRLYAHMLSAEASTSPAVDRGRAAAAAALLAVLEPLAARRRALTTARLFTAWLHGFVMMELAGAFRLGGQVERDFRRGVVMLAAAARGNTGQSAALRTNRNRGASWG